jgi:tryptophan synthase alpha subunit
MTHVVAGYPSEKECVELLLQMQNIGIRMIEVQIPFSDPIADGETIMIANDRALERGMTTQKSFDLIKNARNQGLESNIYIMSYIQKVISYGAENFCQKAKTVGAKGLIIPDLPIGTDEHELLRDLAKKNDLEIVPVVSPGMERERLARDVASAENLIYLTSIKGITGSKLSLSGPVKQTAREIKTRRPDCSLAVGFGIESSEDAKEVLRIADIAVLGSSVIRKIDKKGVKGAVKFLSTLE